jgi:hypothetical protein
MKAFPYQPILTGCLALFSSLDWTVSSVASDIEPEWSTHLESDVKWVESTPFGNLMVATNSGLIGVDPESGKSIWQWDDPTTIASDRLSSIPGSPFYRIDFPNGIKILDPSSGKVVFDSLDAGIYTLEETHFLYDQNAMIAVGNASIGRNRTIAFIDMESAQAKWSLKADAGRILGVESIGGDRTLVVSLFEIRCFESASGRLLWTKPTTPEASQLTGAFGGFMKALAETAIQDTEIHVDFYSSGDRFYIGHGDDVQGTSTYIAYDSVTGSQLWQSDLRSYVGDLLFTPNGIVTLSRVSNSPTHIIGGYRVNLLDPATGKGHWGKNGNGLALKGGVSNYFAVDDQIVISTDAGKSVLVYLLDLKTGSFIHAKPAKLNGNLQALYPFPAGIICIGDSETNLYDHKKGDFVWKKPIRTTPQLTDVREGKFYAFDLKADTLHQLDLSNGSLKTLGRLEAKFGGKERPSRLEARDSGLLLTSSQNLSLIDYSGSTLFHEYYPAPTRSALVKTLYLAQGIRASVIAAQSYYITGAVAGASLTPEFQEADPVAKAIVGGMGAAYGDLALQAHGVAAESFRRAQRRFKATQELNDSLLILVKEEGGTALLKIGKDSGKPQQRVDLGKDKQPKYTIDALENRLYLQQRNQTVAGYSM